jgi:hypothetical protein
VNFALILSLGLLSRVQPPDNIMQLLRDSQDAMKCACTAPCQELSYRYEATTGELLLDNYADVAEQ